MAAAGGYSERPGHTDRPSAPARSSVIRLCAVPCADTEPCTPRLSLQMAPEHRGTPGHPVTPGCSGLLAGQEGQPRPRLRSPRARTPVPGPRTLDPGPRTPAWHRPLPRRHPIKTPVLFSVTSCAPCPGWVTKRLDKPHCARMWLGHSRSPRGHADFPGGSLRDVCGDRRRGLRI